MHKSKTIYGATSIKTGKCIAMKREKHKGEDTVKFLDKIRNIYIKRFQKDKNNKNKKLKVLLIWDNASWHKSKEVKHWLKTKNQGVITLMNLPGYSPELNPQENVWKQMKQHIAEYRGTCSLEELTKIALKFLRTNIFKYSLAGLKN